MSFTSSISATGISGVLSQMDAIEEQMQQLDDGQLLDSALGISSSSGSSATSSTSASGTSSTDFSDALAQAQGTDTSTDTADTTDSSDDGSTATPVATASSASTTEALDSVLSALTGGGGLGDTSSATDTAASDTTAAGSVALPASASTLLTSDQQQFASTLSADTGLSPSVVTSWLLAEESGGAAQARQSVNNNDWLNLGYTDSATYGSSDAIWSDPVTAANATAQWLQGQDSVSGYGTASSGIQAILSSVGQSPEAQISALQNSGWASSGYPDLDSLYAQVTGSQPSTVSD